jgi:hypothetical protein
LVLRKIPPTKNVNGNGCQYMNDLEEICMKVELDQFDLNQLLNLVIVVVDGRWNLYISNYFEIDIKISPTGLHEFENRSRLFYNHLEVLIHWLRIGHKIYTKKYPQLSTRKKKRKNKRERILDFSESKNELLLFFVFGFFCFLISLLLFQVLYYIISSLLVN